MTTEIPSPYYRPKRKRRVPSKYHGYYIGPTDTKKYGILINGDGQYDVDNSYSSDSNSDSDNVEELLSELDHNSKRPCLPGEMDTKRRYINALLEEAENKKDLEEGRNEDYEFSSQDDSREEYYEYLADKDYIPEEDVDSYTEDEEDDTSDEVDDEEDDTSDGVDEEDGTSDGVDEGDDTSDEDETDDEFDEKGSSSYAEESGSE